MLIEILICTYNRVDLLEKVIDSINQAEYPKSAQVRILVVANNCSDGTHAFLDNYKDNRTDTQVELKWVGEPKPGKSNALNCGLGHVEGDVVSFIDDDQKVAWDYLIKLADVVNNDSDTDMWCGRLYPDWDGQEPRWVHDIGEYAIRPLPVPNFDLGDKRMMLNVDTHIPQGGNIIIRRDTLTRTGLFSVDLGPRGHDLGGGEDSDYIIRALNGGSVLAYVPELVQYHYVDSARCTLGYIMKKAHLRTKSIVMVKQDKPSMPPKYIYRKLFSHTLTLMTSLSLPRSRYYLVRIAATLGELSGYWANRKGSS